MYIAIDRKNLVIMDAYRIEVLVRIGYPNEYDEMLKKILSKCDYENSKKTNGTYHMSNKREQIMWNEIDKYNNKLK